MVLIVIGVLLLSGGIVYAVNGEEFAGGSGTEGDPWLISTPRQLDALRNYLGDANNNKYFKLQNDIDLTDFLADKPNGWEPIGDEDHRFCGKLDGDSHIITGLWINRVNETENFLAGLFGLARSATIRNLGIMLDDTKGGITASTASTDYQASVGGLVGYNEAIPNAPSLIENCYVMGNITVGDNGIIGGSVIVGGLVGWQSVGWDFVSATATIRNCYMVGNITNGVSAGGIVGAHQVFSTRGIIENCYIQGSMNGGFFTGGIVGSQVVSQNSSQGAIIKNCYASFVTENKDLTLMGAIVGVHNIYEDNPSISNAPSSISGCVYEQTLPALTAVGTSKIKQDDLQLKTEAVGVSSEDMQKWSTFSGWDSDIWGIYEGAGMPYLKPTKNSILIAPKSMSKIYDNNWQITDPDAYAIEGDYREERPLDLHLSIDFDEPDAGSYQVVMGELAAVPYQVSFADAYYEVVGAFPDIEIKTGSIYNFKGYAVTYKIKVLADDSGHIPAGTIDIFIDDDLLISNLTLDDEGSVVYKTVDKQKGNHIVSVAYQGVYYYYPSKVEQSYNNNLLLYYAAGGMLLL
jgi:hypothetical protein